MRSFVRSFRVALWLATLAFRFVSGRPMSGERKTDATFLRPARHSLDPSGTALRWEMMRGASRAAWRMGGVYLLLLCLLLPALWLTEKVVSTPWYLSFSGVLWSNLLAIGGSASVWSARRIVRERGVYLPRLTETEEGKRSLSWTKIDGRRDWRREKLLPIARSVSVITGTHIPDRKVEDWVEVAKDYREGGIVRVRLSHQFTGADEGVKRRLVSSVGNKLGTPGMLPTWILEGASPELLLAAPPVPPKLVEYSDVEQWLLASEEYRPFLGLTGAGSSLVAEMIDDSPHIALSAGPGAGKSTFAKLVVMQVLRWGWGLVVLDWKQTEAYSWLGGLEGVTYLSGIEEIHDMGVRIHEEVDLRKALGMAGRAKVMVLRDEWNVTADLLMAYWQDLRSTAEPDEKRTMPVKSPALRGYGVLDFAGREYGLFDFCIAQRFSARVFNGNADIRECFQIKCLARYSDSTRKMLAPDIKPFPRKSNVPGRWTIVTGDDVSVIQVPLITNEQARAYAVGGMANPVSPFSSSYGATSVRTHIALEDQLPPGQPGVAPVTSGSLHEHSSPVLLKLSEMVDRLAPLGVTLKILQKAAGDTESGFPMPVGGNPNRGYTYDFSTVREWARNRHASKIIERMT